MSEFIIVITSIDKKTEAEGMAKKLMKKRLAGCIKIVGPVKSFYTWKEKARVAKEWTCIIKTKKGNYAKIESEIRKMHKYELPEIISFEVGKASRKYLEWLDSAMI